VIVWAVVLSRVWPGSLVSKTSIVVRVIFAILARVFAVPRTNCVSHAAIQRPVRTMAYVSILRVVAAIAFGNVKPISAVLSLNIAARPLMA